MPNPLPNLKIKGRILGPDAPDWDETRRSFNVLVDARATALTRPVDEADVIAIVNYAREHGLAVAPEATAHNAAAHGSLENAIIVSTAEFQEVTVDVGAQRVRVGAGVKWEKVVPTLSDHGLAGLHGSSPDVGLAGYSLGGGIGWLSRTHGMHTNSVTAFELVTADGRFVRATHENEPDLFWALRGGNGNYGVVTSIEFKVYPLEEIYAGALFFPFERASEVLHTWRELLPTFPDELMTWANILHFPPDPALPEEFRGGSFAIVMGAYQGEEDDGRELLGRLRDLGPQYDTFGMHPPAFLADLAMDPPDPLPIASGHALLEELSPELLDRFLAIAGPDSGTGTALTMLQLRHMGGALGRKSPGAGARATLPGEVNMFALGVVIDEETGRVIESAISGLVGAAHPYRAGYYPNFVEENADARNFWDEVTWTRLRKIKSEYDPTNLFRGNHYIAPAEDALPKAA